MIEDILMILCCAVLLSILMSEPGPMIIGIALIVTAAAMVAHSVFKARRRTVDWHLPMCFILLAFVFVMTGVFFLLDSATEGIGEAALALSVMK